MEAGLILWMVFISSCILVIVMATYKSMRQDGITINNHAIPQQPIKIDVHMDAPKMPSADDIADSLLKKSRQKQLAAQPQWRIEQGKQGHIPQRVQPRLGNEKKEVVKL